MYCYCCAKQGIDRPAVALCRSCNGALCLEHLHETAAHLASGHLFSSCRHDTWSAPGSHPPWPASRRPTRAVGAANGYGALHVHEKGLE